MDKEIKDLVRRRLWDGQIHDLFNEIRELLESEPPLSSEKDVDDFLNHATWKDFVKELQVMMEQLTGSLMAGDSGYSDNYLRGQMSAFSVLLQLPEYIKEQARQMAEEDENV